MREVKAPKGQLHSRGAAGCNRPEAQKHTRRGWEKKKKKEEARFEPRAAATYLRLTFITMPAVRPSRQNHVMSKSYVTFL